MTLTIKIITITITILAIPNNINLIPKFVIWSSIMVIMWFGTLIFGFVRFQFI